MSLVYRSTAGRRLTVSEGDLNIYQLSNASGVSFVAAGVGGLSETTQAAIRRLVHTDQYSTAANFNTARDALTGTIGLSPKVEITHALDAGSYPITFKTANTDVADFNFSLGDFAFESIRDTVMRLGYNAAHGGSNRDSSEPSHFLSWESRYKTGGVEYMEFHWEGIHGDLATPFRAWSWMINKSTNFIDHSIAASKISLYDGTRVNQAVVFNFSTNACTITPLAGTRFEKEPNNAQWLSQLNAAGNAYIEIARVNASNVVYIAPAGGGARVHTTLTIGDSASPMIRFNQSSGGTTVAALYENGDVLYLAEEGVGNRVAFTIGDGTIYGCVAQAIPAGGLDGVGLKLSSTANFGVFFGSGAPSLSAAKGSLYLRSDGGGTTDRAYINTNGTTTWTALTTVA